MAPLERLKILMQVQGSEKVYTGVFQVRDGPARVAGVGRIGGTQCHVSRPRVHVCVLGGGADHLLVSVVAQKAVHVDECTC